MFISTAQWCVRHSPTSQHPPAGHLDLPRDAFVATSRTYGLGSTHTGNTLAAASTPLCWLECCVVCAHNGTQHHSKSTNTPQSLHLT